MDKLETQIVTLKEELREKNQIITQLQKEHTIVQLLNGYIHLENNITAPLSYSLAKLLKECERKGITDHIQEIIDDFDQLMKVKRNFYRYARERSEIMKVEELIDNCIEIILEITKRANINLRHVSEHKDPTTVPTELTYAIINIILNSIESTIYLRETKKVESNEIIVKSSSENGNIKIEIIDNGVGIGKEIIDKIWDIGFTTKTNHLGLGLSTSKNIINKLKGEIKVESTINVITNFTIMIPAKLS